ncbi:MAG TPA: protein translocase subunit SecDF [Bacteroidales bacterium]|nr:protein translocase subunit SecDF [Bacteroidales bacterium]
MRNKGAIVLVTVLFTLICLYYLTFTFAVKRVENKAEKYAESQFTAMNLKVDEARQLEITDSLVKYYLDSVENLPALTLFAKHTYMDCKKKELNLGLDLKGGMNVSLRISAEDLILSLANNPNDPTLLAALEETNKIIDGDDETNFITIFGESYSKVKDPKSSSLAALFSKISNSDKINAKSTDKEVIDYINAQYEDAIDNAFVVLRKRIDLFGVVSPNIQKDIANRGVFHIELPGIKEPERVEDLLKQAAVLEFWETKDATEIRNNLAKVDDFLTQNEEETIAIDTTNIATDTTDIDTTTNIVDVETNQSEQTQTRSITKRMVFNIGDRGVYGPVLGYVKKADKDALINDLNADYLAGFFGNDVVFACGYKPVEGNIDYYEVVVLQRSKATGGAALSGDVVTDARQEFDERTGQAHVSMSMNSAGATEWARITKENIGKSIAIVLDHQVYSYPNVNDEIKGGHSSISGNFTLDEATDLANVLKSGKMVVSVSIISSEVVGPSLGQKAIDSGFASFIIAFIIVLLYMIFYYNRAGLVANIALLANVFFVFGVLASIGAVLTLPGIAGIVLTMGMAIDANVIIYERVREEIRAGKQIKSALVDGYKRSYPAILDGNITTLLVGIVLAMFGVGPVKGFATTLIIGILTSLFSSLFITRLIFASLLKKEKKINFGNKFTNNLFVDLNFGFIKNRKIFYTIAGSLAVISLVLLFTKGLNQGVDFTGGRDYIVKFEQAVEPEEVAKALETVYEDLPIVKTYGTKNQVKITTNYKIKEKDTDQLVDSLLYVGLKPLIGDGVSYEKFNDDYKVRAQKVGPSVASDIVKKSILVVIIGLALMFVYILVRFTKWQYSTGATVALAYNALLILGVFSLFDNILPFNMEVDQTFIAAVLTVIGYSINDTVVIFDRLREHQKLYKNRPLDQTINYAINSTIGRTVNTTMSTLLVVIAIFVFGGEVIRGFTFALLVGIATGAFSSICLASPIVYDLTQRSLRKQKKELKK